MPLRETLRYVAPDPDLVDRLMDLADEILDRIDAREPCDAEIAAVRELTGKDHYDLRFFMALPGSEDAEDFAEKAAAPVHVVPDLGRDELVEIVRLAIAAERAGDFVVSDYYVDLFERHVPMSGARSLLSQPKGFRPGDDLSGYRPTAEEIVDAATAPDTAIRL